MKWRFRSIIVRFYYCDYFLNPDEGQCERGCTLGQDTSCLPMMYHYPIFPGYSNRCETSQLVEALQWSTQPW